MEKSKVTQQKITGLSELDLRAKYDNLFKIRAAVKKLQKGIFLPDQQMRELCKISTIAWRGYSENPEFEKFKLKVADGVLWSTPESVKKMKGYLNVA